MMKQKEKVYLGLLMVTAWFTLIFQFYLHINSGVAASSELLVRFFSYFTIDSNLLVALCSTAILLMPQTAFGRFFKKPSVVTAITIYITVVALVYNTVLRFLWMLSGWAIVLNELLHVIVPILFLIYWIYFVPKHQLKWANVWGWLVFPLIYISFVLIRGSYVNFYPYPFLNVTELGLQQVILNCIFITLLFVILFLAFIAIGKRQAKKLPL
ncbi:Pr6Pr family membrane protein [Pedobacter sp.]|uniref:Pr6Pr family membrane protein n=1 Tax=Pedobacter sp. TaxID=1411316 RepID=UPI0031D90E79